jgi:7-keto-8-aminopelargonate synthetase-like enzyme
MDGHVAKLNEICELADQYDALVMVDDSHAVGVVGPGGRGTPELHDVVDRVDVLTGTLGKAMGGASGGYVSERAEIVELLRQRAHPYLFSKSTPLASLIQLSRAVPRASARRCPRRIVEATWIARSKHFARPETRLR